MVQVDGSDNKEYARNSETQIRSWVRKELDTTSD